MVISSSNSYFKSKNDVVEIEHIIPPNNGIENIFNSDPKTKLLFIVP